METLKPNPDTIFTSITLEEMISRYPKVVKRILDLGSKWSLDKDTIKLSTKSFSVEIPSSQFDNLKQILKDEGFIFQGRSLRRAYYRCMGGLGATVVIKVVGEDWSLLTITIVL